MARQAVTRRVERRQVLRRDMNDIVRDEHGNLSAVKMGLLSGQIIAVYLLLKHSEYVIDRWDSLATLMIALTAPDVLKKVISMKYGSNGGAK